jgi:long-chain fatty acid transport protein
MQIRGLRVAVIVCLLVGLVGSASLFATDGYFSHGYGTAQKAMGGAGVALWFGPMDVATNPAATVFSGPGLDFGVAAFTPDRKYEVTGNPSGYPNTFGLAPGEVSSDSPWFANPHAALALKAGKSAMFGLAMYGNGGMNTDYNTKTFGNAPTGVNLIQMFFAPSYAVKLGEKHAVGASILLGYQRFEAKGLQAFSAFSSSPSTLSNNSVSGSLGYGVRVGYLGQLTPYLSVGASYQSRMKMGAFDGYSGLFAEKGGFDMPSNWVVGLAVKPTKRVALALDVQQIRYSEVKAIGNPMLPNLMTAALGTDNGAGFGWKDVTTVKTGVQYAGPAGYTLRAGYSFGKQPVPESEVLFNILAPGVVEHHVTFGMSKDLTAKGALNLAVMKALSKSVTGSNPLEVPGRQQIKLTMSEWEFELGYTMKF